SASSAVRSSALRLPPETLDDREAASRAEGLRCHAQDRRGLLAFVFRVVHPTRDALDRGSLVAEVDDRLDALALLDIGVKDGIEDLVRRERVLIALIRTKLGGRRLLDRRQGDD